jgi:hypothetical protein
MTLYGERAGALRPVLRIAMPRSPRIYARGETMHVQVGGQGFILAVFWARESDCFMSRPCQTRRIFL